MVENTRKLDNQNESLEILIHKWYSTNNKVVDSEFPSLEEISLPTNGRIITSLSFITNIINTNKSKTSSFYKDETKNLETRPIIKLQEFSYIKFIQYQIYNKIVIAIKDYKIK